MTHTEQAVQDVALIARNGIDRVIKLEQQNAALQAQVAQLQNLSDELFATMVAAQSLAPAGGAAYKLLDESLSRLHGNWLRPEGANCTEQNRTRSDGACP